MLELLSSARDAYSRCCSVRDAHETAPIRSIAPGEILFQMGDPHGDLYRVERGALCHYTRSHAGRHEIIEFVFPGGILGFGHIAVHVSTAKAMLYTEISIVPPQEFERALQTDGQLAARVAAAADREFDYLRFWAMELVRNKPMERRLASFLVALSHISAREGPGAELIPDEILSGAVADHINVSIDDLASAIRQLEARGLLALSNAGLRINDIAALERFADAGPLQQSSDIKLEASVI
jgi:CRP/FNR family transcriptional regulator